MRSLMRLLGAALLSVGLLAVFLLVLAFAFGGAAAGFLGQFFFIIATLVVLAGWVLRRLGREGPNLDDPFN